MTAFSTQFTPIEAAVGGAMIGLAAMLLMLLNGRIAGMTGILAGILPPAPARDWAWRAAFLLAAAAAPFGYVAITGTQPVLAVPVGREALIAGGLIVGVGVTLGSGCTSGHGICGLARFSPRSLAAVVAFMLSTGLTVFVIRHLI